MKRDKIDKAKNKFLQSVDKELEKYKNADDKEGIQSIQAFKKNLSSLNDSNYLEVLELLTHMSIDNPYLFKIPYDKFEETILFDLVSEIKKKTTDELEEMITFRRKELGRIESRL